MNDISGFEDIARVPPPPRPASQDELGQSDFLTLMITQFRNQDPFEPMDNGDFLSQLAQFGTVNGIEELGTSFEGLSASIQGDQALQAANLVGHTVLAASNGGYLQDGVGLSGAVELPSSVTSLQIEITDAAGQIVQRFDLGEQPSGLARFEWDGQNLEGESVAEGHYQITARAVRGRQVESVEVLIASTVESVSLDRFGRGITLNLPGGDSMSLSQVRRIL